MRQCQFYLALNNTLYKLKINATFKLLNHHQVTAGSHLEGFYSCFKMGDIFRALGGITAECVCVCVYALLI